MSDASNTNVNQALAEKSDPSLFNQHIAGVNKILDTSKSYSIQSQDSFDLNIDSIVCLPAQPKTLVDTDLAQQLIVELVAKTMLGLGKTHLSLLTLKLKLSINVLNEVLGFMVIEHMVEIVRRGNTDIDIEYQLTDTGKVHARDFMARCSYTGPAPVTLGAYQTMVAQQSVNSNRITKQDIEAVFFDFTLNAEIRDQIGAAMNSGRPLFLYGPAGSGKTFLSEKLSRLLPGLIAIPHAIVIENEIIQVYDASLHSKINTTHVYAEARLSTQNYRQTDNRWIVCKRPVVITGGELTLDMLDLAYDSTTGFYQAPPHFKANNGIFIVDDLGRQRVSPQDLMNRWLIPMEHAHDYLTLHTGYKFTIPFDVSLVFSTNLSPSLVADESFLRRLGYKIYIGPLSEDEYRKVIVQHAKAIGVIYDEMAFRYLIDHLHQKNGQPLIACYSRDLLSQIVDYARYYEETPMMTQQSLDRAWLTYFATDSH